MLGLVPQGLTSADGKNPRKKEIRLTPRAGRGVRHGSRFDSDSVIPLLPSPVSPNSHRFYCLDGGRRGEGTGLGPFPCSGSAAAMPSGLFAIVSTGGMRREGGKATALCI